MNKFDQKEYIKEFKKKYYKQFKAELFNADFEILNNLLNEKKLTKADFIRIAKSLLEDGELKMKHCDDVVMYLKNKRSRVDFINDDEHEKYSEQSKKDIIVLKDGYLYYKINEEENECYILVSKGNAPNDTNNISLKGEYFDGYFNMEVLEKLLDLIA